MTWLDILVMVGTVLFVVFILTRRHGTQLVPIRLSSVNDWRLNEDGLQLLKLVLGSIETLQNEYYRGPYRLYLSAELLPVLTSQYRPGANKTTVLDRLLEIQGMQEVVVGSKIKPWYRVEVIES